ncbi:predicted protein [Naegleria gruberi]|uniref:Predicted protein n=1 Tax=Naegleria gruberi TaxID=5762 RepID=D2VF20_NAEGR|nr:uncharacterized protein NAEGRDRAFT_49011 [Naegleria gruberi]EFC44607.1 predicted protein [Naegleria gruberi]|eukprot:XP_002677351.1 predicted protein [Naegleria gruberi strain NEG-M]
MVRVKIADLGLSKIVDHDTIKHSKVGTHYYLPPEVRQQTTEEIIPEKIDIWSFGILVFRLLSRDFTYDVASKLVNSKEKDFCEDVLMKMIQNNENVDCGVVTNFVTFLTPTLKLKPSERYNSLDLFDLCFNIPNNESYVDQDTIDLLVDCRVDPLIIGICYFSLKQTEKSIHYLEKVLENKTENNNSAEKGFACAIMAFITLFNGKNRTIVNSEKEYKVNPDFLRYIEYVEKYSITFKLYHLLKSKQYFMSQHYEKSIEHADQCIEHIGSASSLKACCLHGLGYYDKALEVMKKINPKTEMDYRNMSYIYLVEYQNYEEALKCANSALELNPGVPDFYLLKVCCLASAAPSEALTCLKNARKLIGKVGVYYYHKGRIYLNMGRLEMALSKLNKAQELGEESMNLIAVLEMALGRLPEALISINRYLEKYPNNITAHNNKFKILIMQNLTEEAKIELELIEHLKRLNIKTEKTIKQQLYFENDKPPISNISNTNIKECYFVSKNHTFKRKIKFNSVEDLLKQCRKEFQDETITTFIDENSQVCDLKFGTFIHGKTYTVTGDLYMEQTSYMSSLMNYLFQKR